MQRNALILLTALTVVLIAACGGNTPVTPNGATPALPPEDDASTGGGDAGDGFTEGDAFDPFPFGTPVPEESDEGQVSMAPTLLALGAPIQPTLAATLPPFGGINIDPAELGNPGEVQINSIETEEANSGADASVDPSTLLFDQLSLTRAGGPGNRELRIEIFQDGTVLLDGTQATVLTPQQIVDLDGLLDEVRFFDISGTFAATFPSPGAYIYIISAEQAGSSISHRADDALMPPELSRVVGQITDLALGAQPGPND